MNGDLSFIAEGDHAKPLKQSRCFQKHSKVILIYGLFVRFIEYGKEIDILMHNLYARYNPGAPAFAFVLR
jgi:hypothetical protein